ncbi:hypothetical protein TTV25_gp1 [Torque teno virus 25]|uniref:Uncharacterized ORF2 protein n=1 Tax=Torque teno virus (isolate Japanese macaque/Japan/Mf-TTV9/2000) TaxID=687364 RepID=YORF2_TTVV9|nr:hypothetical protein TTV25_gp1 [Torque teno virus 25]Q9DUC5.1 RecName: Full=Uncharacterized ORF2 protein [Torque teno virus 25]BAB19312.1 unnamed protein product [Torque teno virus 25]
MTNQWEPTTLNAWGREEAWLRSVVDSHQSFCGCNDPGFHLGLLLHSAGRHLGGPGGPQPPPAPGGPGVGGEGPRRFLPLPGLPANPEEPGHQRPPCPGGPGDAGGAGGVDAETGEGEWRPEDIAELLDGLEDAEKR